MEKQDEIWGVIVNPYAGTRKLRKDWIHIYKLLKKANIRFKHQATAFPSHAVEIARGMVEQGFRHLLIVGGDGTLNEVVNGIYTSNIEDKHNVTLALIPYGTGNDWGRYWGIKRNDKSIAQRLSQRNVHTIDIGRVTLYHDEQPQEQYFINGFGLGFDGFVVKITNQLKKFLGGSAWTYRFSVFAAVFGYSAKQMTLASPDKTVQENIFTISVGNGCYSGGGLKQTPKAVPTDGLFHITAIQRPNLWKIIIGLKQLLNDQLDMHPLAHTFVTDTFLIESEKPVLTEVDGVLLPLGTKFKVDNLHAALKMMV